MLSHDKGNTIRVVLETFNELGYYIDFNVFNSKYYGVPQNRERAERKAEKEAYKQRQEKERLQMIEDAKRRSKWFEHLSENDVFPKVVK